jgi:hypothetical protein
MNKFDPFYMQQPTINYIISGMYENMKSITCDFEMKHNDKIVTHGKAIINKCSEAVCLIGRYEDVNVEQFKVGNTVHINYVPMVYQVRLFNFPDRDRIAMLKGKNVSVDMPKFNIYANFTVDMSNDMFEIYGQPLMDVESREIVDIRIW